MNQLATTEIEGIKLDSTNEEFNSAVEFVQQTGKPVYLTGKAGTGKTTFLKYITQTVKKNMVVLAPTGVAAINAGGQTIHSFFKIKPSIYVPGDMRLRAGFNPNDTDKSTIHDNFKYQDKDLKILQGLELLIIDEISMVRCDLLDVVDRLLRFFRKRLGEPFGGVQVILIGDTFQLPPIAQEPEWDILKRFYENPFFFSSRVIRENKPVYIELKKIYRQKEQEFIDLLNRVRVNQVTQNEIKLLNSKFNPVFTPPESENYIMLATHNEIVNRTNLTKLEELPDELKIFEATVTGDFPENIMPTDRVLQLKENAQVMFIKNDRGKRYYNGKIAKITQMNGDGMFAELSGENKIIVEKETWENIKYVWNDRKKKIEENVIGTFTQYPVKLAWAITVHKSQGLTFDRVIADLGQAFAPGQVYVALSRCTTFSGLILRTQLNRNAIKTAPEVLDFARNEMPSTLIVQELKSGRADLYYKKVRESLKQFRFEEAYNSLIPAIKHRNDIETDKFKRYFNVFASRLASYRRKYDSAKSDLDRITAQNLDLQKNIAELNGDIDGKNRKNSEQNSAIKLLLDRMKEFEDINRNQNETVQSLQLALDDKNVAVDRLEKDRKTLSKNLEDAQRLAKKQEAEILSLKQEIERINGLKWYQKIAGKT
ncbi:MAG: AAA family ATPase [Tannerella sp.]|jgi:energy-coupling factor transporter ATP-binding protein EcfA2|nr:AAA family ATPase [Tannerella sp.]